MEGRGGVGERKGWGVEWSGGGEGIGSWCGGGEGIGSWGEIAETEKKGNGGRGRRGSAIGETDIISFNAADSLIFPQGTRSKRDFFFISRD